MPPEFFYSAGLLGLLLTYFIYETVNHRRNVCALKLRIHVNGTRGKSSVTRLIAAGLRSGGYQVFGKTTGTQAMYLLPDGSEQLIPRRGPANIRETVQAIRNAVNCQADTIVFECMALQPELQWCCEQQMIKSHIGVITNIRLDHEDVMGEGRENIARALSNTIPNDGVLIITNQTKALLNEFGLGDLTKMVAIDPGSITDRDLDGFAFTVVRENVALAVAVCETAGVDRNIALAGMRQMIPDSGNLTIYKISLGGRIVRVVNAFAANDPESTLQLWTQYVPGDEPTIVLLNCRRDRKYRTRQLCESLAAVQWGIFILHGDTVFAQSVLQRCHVKPSLIRILGQAFTDDDLEKIIQEISYQRITLFAAGNIHGIRPLFAGKERTL